MLQGSVGKFLECSKQFPNEIILYLDLVIYYISFLFVGQSHEKPKSSEYHSQTGIVSNLFFFLGGGGVV